MFRDAAQQGRPQWPVLAPVAGQVQRGQVHELEEQATFTNPEDQSAWMHCRWLLSRSLALHAAARRAAWEAQAREVPFGCPCHWARQSWAHV